MSNNIKTTNAVFVEESFDKKPSTRDEQFARDSILDNVGELIKSDIQILNEMGFDKIMINKVYILLKPENINIAIDYMTQIDGIYQHNFFKNNIKSKDPNICFICKKHKSKHIDYIPENLIEDNNINILPNEKNDNVLIEDFENRNDKNLCIVCLEKLTDEELEFNKIECGHICCSQCWGNYLKTLIREAKVEHIRCISYQCKNILSDEFILKHINEDKTIVEKYEKFKKKLEILNDKNKKQCPFPDCDSYLEKITTKNNNIENNNNILTTYQSTISNINDISFNINNNISNINDNYVACKNGHKFCFECLKPWHGTTTCEQMIEKDFAKWKKNKIVKRCPNCKIFTEKNEGCNHMTCPQCDFQWCWLCEGEYKYGHFENGKCKGYQFIKADNLIQANSIRKHENKIKWNCHHVCRTLITKVENVEEDNTCCCLSVREIFPIFYGRFNNSSLTFHSNAERYFIIFLAIFFGFFLLTIYGLIYFIGEQHIKCSCFAVFVSVFISLCLFICYHIIFLIIISPFLIIAIIFPRFIQDILYFFAFGI